MLDYSDNQAFANYVAYLGTQGAAFPMNTLMSNISHSELVTVIYDHDFETLWDFWLQFFFNHMPVDYALLQALGSDYHSYLQDWNGLYQVSPQFLSQVIRKQKIALTSHTLYGSSRLGVKQYMPGQFYAQWDYTGTVPALDTAFLTQRLPWYSHAQNDVIAPAAEDPVGHSDTSIYAVQHQRGMLQYELTNHLGNVQATVSDGRVPNWVGTDSVSYYKPAIAAAYDYYPFGMLMPGRYVQDTSSKCMTISSNKWMTQPVSYCKNASSSWPWYPIVMNSGVNISFSGGMPVLNFYNMSAVLQLNIPKGSSSLTNQRTFSLELLGSVSGVVFALVSESDNGSFTFFQQQITGSNPVVTMPFVPLGHPNEQIMLYMISLSGTSFFAIQQACLTEDEQKLQTVLVDVCNDAGDRYPFGFGAQEKDNEWAGIGNHYEYRFRGYDPRTGRFFSVDPLAYHYPWYAPYQFAGNDPIRNIDLEGLEPTGYDIRSRQNDQAFLKGEKSESEWQGFYRDNATAGAIGGAMILDATLLKGKASQFLSSTIMAGSFYDNQSKSPGVDKLRSKEFKENIVWGGMIWGVGKVLGNIVRSAGVSQNELRVGAGLRQSDEVNATFSERGWHAPYKSGVSLAEFKTPKNWNNLVRLSGPSNVKGSWFTTADQIKGLSPGQLRGKFSLKYEPTNMTPVSIEAGSNVRVGEAAGIRAFGTKGGGYQIEVLEGKVNYGQTQAIKN